MRVFAAQVECERDKVVHCGCICKALQRRVRTRVSYRAPSITAILRMRVCYSSHRRGCVQRRTHVLVSASKKLASVRGQQGWLGHSSDCTAHANSELCTAHTDLIGQCFLGHGGQYTCMHSAENEKDVITTRAGATHAIHTEAPEVPHSRANKTERSLLPACRLRLRLDHLLHDLRLLDEECPENAGEERKLRHRDFEADKQTYRCLTQSPHLEPPYALRTVFFVFETVAYWRGRRAITWQALR